MKQIFWCLFAALLVSASAEAQSTRYIVRFRNKGDNPFTLANPAAYLSPRAIDRRTRYAIPYDSTDLPVTPRYLDSVRLAGAVTILNTSKWLNSVTIQTSDADAVSKINRFPFVLAISGAAPRLAATTGTADKFRLEREAGPQPQPKELNILADFFNYGSSYNQVHIHNGEFLHNIGLRGQNMVIGLLDAGFQNYLTVKAFDSIRANGQILGVYDFVAKDNSVNEDDSHGMQCLSTIAANIPGQFVGTAPKAAFYLFRSENASTEFPIEEHNWVCAAERVDSVGGDLLSSSLGYNTFDAPFTSANHTYADMNGNTTMPAIGADLAAKKGILVVNSAGNEGNNSWHYLITPADGDSVMAVGAVNTAGTPAGFTSLGPSSDGQVKPDVASHGVATTVQLPNNTIGTNNGTSFAAPNLAGLTTCLWQGFPEYNNMRIIGALRQAGSRASNPNDTIGYGIPNVKRATLFLLKDFATTTATLGSCKTTISWTSKDVSAMKYEIERQLAGQNTFTKIAEQGGTGASFASHNYQYEDVLTGVLAGSITYRIRQIVDTSAAGFTADYIDTVVVNLGVNCTVTAVDPVDPAANSITLLPNPARDALTVKVTTAAAAPRLTIRLFDARGQAVYTTQKSKGSGTASFAISLASFAKGKYYVSVYNGTVLIATKELIKL